MRGVVAGSYRNSYAEEGHNLYPSPNLIRIIKSRSMRWVGHLEGTGDIINAHGILVGKNEEKSLGRFMRKWDVDVNRNV